MWWSLFFPVAIIVGYWVAPSKSTIITKSVKFCWTAVEWYTILEIRSSMFIDKMKLLITKPITPITSIEAESSQSTSNNDPNQESVIQ